jgi:hypothetical protein
MKMHLLTTGIFLILFINPSSFLFSQNESASNFSMGADLTSRYIWRGINLGGSSPHIQPSVEYTFGNTGISAGAWGSYSLGHSGFAEADLYLSYAPTSWISFTLTDYFFPNDNIFERNDYFNYKKNQTRHTLEGMVTIGEFENLPLYLTFAMNFYGADGVDESGKNLNAKYFEVGYNGMTRDIAWSVFAGASPDNPGTGGAGWYGDKPGVINLGVCFAKEFSIAGKSFPVTSAVIFNPEAGNFYLVTGISF